MLTASSTLAIFAMIGLSSIAVFWAKRVNLPHTVLLVIIGLVIKIISYELPTLQFFHEFILTPELLFFLLLPTLIFESAYQINIRRMVEDIIPILALSVISLLISAAIIGYALYFLLPFVGFQIPLIVTLLFGALISIIDAVAVLALFKESGAPRRLSMIFEGESLFNDATGLALFLILLNVITFGYNGFETIQEGLISFSSMMIGGIVFGLLVGGIFVKLVGMTKDNEIASITLTVVLAHITFILAEIISHHFHIGSLNLPVSPIIATTIAALVMGNYGRPKIPAKTQEFVHKLWEQLAFMANSMIFILVGILLTKIPLFEPGIITVIILTVLVVALARAFSVYSVIGVTNPLTPKERRIPTNYQHLLSWASLRGALSVTLILMVPTDLSLPGWNLNMSIEEFLLALTLGCIFATLFIKATTIRSLVKKLKLDTLTKIEKVEYQEARALIHHQVSEKISLYNERGYINDETTKELNTIYKEYFETARKNIHNLTDDTEQTAHQVLRLFAIGIEKHYLKELYTHEEINEAVFRHIIGKLQLQYEAIEHGNLSPDLSLYRDSKDVFESMVSAWRKFIAKENKRDVIAEKYMYYRAQTILSRKVLVELTRIDNIYAKHIFTPRALTHTTELYEKFKIQTAAKMKELETAYPDIIIVLQRQLAASGVLKIEEYLLNDLLERELITPKLFVTLTDEFKEKSSIYK